MIVACPSCQSRFNLDPAKLLPAGRNVRCAKCGHRWRQMPEGLEEPVERIGTPSPAAAALPEPPAEPIPEPQPASQAGPSAEEPEAQRFRPPETPAEMAQSLAAIAEQVAGAHRSPTGGEGYTVTHGAPRALPENPISRLARRGQGLGPITVPPRMRPMRPAKRNSRLSLILLAGFVLGLLIAAYAFRGVIARTVPGADMVYALFGLSTDNPAADLEISVDDFGVIPDEKTGQHVFQVRATVFNPTAYPVDIPPLMIIPVDDAGSQMEPRRFRLHEQVVEPGQNIKFQQSFDNWPAGAPTFMLTVANAR